MRSRISVYRFLELAEGAYDSIMFIGIILQLVNAQINALAKEHYIFLFHVALLYFFLLLFLYCLALTRVGVSSRPTMIKLYLNGLLLRQLPVTRKITSINTNHGCERKTRYWLSMINLWST